MPVLLFINRQDAHTLAHLLLLTKRAQGVRERIVPEAGNSLVVITSRFNVPLINERGSVVISHRFSLHRACAVTRHIPLVYSGPLGSLPALVVVSEQVGSTRLRHSRRCFP